MQTRPKIFFLSSLTCYDSNASLQPDRRRIRNKSPIFVFIIICHEFVLSNVIPLLIEAQYTIRKFPYKKQEYTKNKQERVRFLLMLRIDSVDGKNLKENRK